MLTFAGKEQLLLILFHSVVVMYVTFVFQLFGAVGKSCPFVVMVLCLG
jgi:hypothetical protein